MANAPRVSYPVSWSKPLFRPSNIQTRRQVAHATDLFFPKAFPCQPVLYQTETPFFQKVTREERPKMIREEMTQKRGQKEKHSQGSYVKAHNSLLLAPNTPLQKQASYLCLWDKTVSQRLVIVICAWVEAQTRVQLIDYPCDKEMPKGELELGNPSEIEWIAVCT